MRYFPYGLEARLRAFPWISGAAIALAVSLGEYPAAVFLALFAFPLEERSGKTAFATFLAAGLGVGWTVAQYGEAPWSVATAPVNAVLASYLFLFAGERQRFGSVRFPAGLYAFAGILLALLLPGGALERLAGFGVGLGAATLLRFFSALESGLVFPYEREFLLGATRARTLSEKLGYCFQWLERNPSSALAARLCVRYAGEMIQERGNPQAGNFVAHARAWFTRDGFERFAEDAELTAAVPVSWLIESGDADLHRAALNATRRWRHSKSKTEKKARWKALLFIVHHAADGDAPARGENPFLKAFHTLCEEVLTDSVFIDELQSEALAVPEVLAALESYGIWLGLAKSKY